MSRLKVLTPPLPHNQGTLGSYTTQLQVGAFQRPPVCHLSIAHSVPQGRPLSLGPLDGQRTLFSPSTHPASGLATGEVVRVLGSSTPLPAPHPLTTLGHHALLRLGCLSLAHGAVRWAHLDHAVPLLHAHPAGGAALIPLAPLGHQAAAGSWEAGPVAVVSAASATALPLPALPGRPYSQHSSLTVHFSVSSVGSVHTEPSSGNCFTYLSRDRMPMPQEMLQGDHVIHSDMVQVEPSATHERTLRACAPSSPGQGAGSNWPAFPSPVLASSVQD